MYDTLSLLYIPHSSVLLLFSLFLLFLFFFNDTATTEIYTLSLHDALPIWRSENPAFLVSSSRSGRKASPWVARRSSDRKSTRLNSSHITISYAVFCLKKKKKKKIRRILG